MNSQAQSSINFVISAVYTVTFANTVYLMTVNNPSQSFALSNISWLSERIICGFIALIMTLRFFFGNNQFIADVMQDKTKLPWTKFYHFVFIAIQSIVLLVCSYSLRLQVEFIFGITSLFVIELIWYFLTMIIDKNCVLPKNKIEKKSFFLAQMSNLGFVVGIIIISLFMNKNGICWLLLSFIFFIFNTFIDVRKNMGSYMT